MSMSRFFTAIFLSLWAASAQAASVTWSIDIEFEDDGTAVGSFDWDTEINAVTAWDITVSAGLMSLGVPLPGQTFSSASAGHVVEAFTSGGYSFLDFKTDDVTYWFGPDRPRTFRLGIGFGGFDVLDTPVAALPLVPDTVNMFPISTTGVSDCGSCSPFRNGKPGSVISAAPVPTPVPLPGAFPLALIGGVAFGSLRRRKRQV